MTGRPALSKDEMEVAGVQWQLKSASVLQVIDWTFDRESGLVHDMQVDHGRADVFVPE